MIIITLLAVQRPNASTNALGANTHDAIANVRQLTFLPINECLNDSFRPEQNAVGFSFAAYTVHNWQMLAFQWERKNNFDRCFFFFLIKLTCIYYILFKTIKSRKLSFITIFFN